MMAKRMMIWLMVCCLGCALQAQTLNQAKKLFNEGRFEQAKPAFHKFVRQSPGNAQYNFWYGACCYETGEKELAEKYLEKAADRKVINAYRYLAQLRADQYRFDEAVENMEEHLVWLEKKERDTEEAEALLDYIRRGARMLKGTEQVAIIDSFVVDKATFLSAYKLSPEAGILEFYDTYFKTDTHPGCVLYQTELENKVFFAQKEQDTLRLYMQDRLSDKWGDPVRLKGLQSEGNENYPYVLADGVTLYFAQDGQQSLGGLDIFVTRFNSETNRYLRPENIGMPFNSPANDYMYAIDEYNQLGWFASDRYQPEGKVCVYVFIPNDTRLTYNFEGTDEAVIRRAAMIQGITSTWNNQTAVQEAKQRLTAALSREPELHKKRHDFEFVIDDFTTYYHLTDFKSAQATQLFLKWQNDTKYAKKLAQTLEEKRLSYYQADETSRKNMTKELLDLEQQVERLQVTLMDEEINIRNTEKNFISK